MSMQSKVFRYVCTICNNTWMSYDNTLLQFLKLVSLLGHKDWVRALHFVNEGNL